MKLISVIFTAALLSLAEVGSSQGFVNLNFESASLVPVPGDPYGSVQYPQAFPGWTETVVGGISTNALYNNVFLDSAGITIIDHNWTNVSYIPGGLIQGNYTAILQSGLGYTTNGAAPADISLSQTGQVPVGTQSLQFKIYEDFDSRGAFAVTLGGQTLFLTSLGTGANYTLYGANVSEWAGQTVPLAFTVFGENPHQNDEYLYLDAIQFSTQSIPEPSELALAALGALLLGLRRRHR